MPAMTAFGAANRPPGGRKFRSIDRIARIARGTGENHVQPSGLSAKIGGGGDDRKRRKEFAPARAPARERAYFPLKIKVCSAHGSLRKCRYALWHRARSAARRQF